jgi:hypothetical protein
LRELFLRMFGRNIVWHLIRSQNRGGQLEDAKGPAAPLEALSVGTMAPITTT